MLWENFLLKTGNDITDLWLYYEASLPRWLRFYASNISLFRKSAEDVRRDVKLWASRSEANNAIDVDFPLDEGDYGKEPVFTAEYH